MTRKKNLIGVNLIVHQNLECLTVYFHILGGNWRYETRAFKPLLQDKQRFPDSLFSASASSEGHNASDARISSGSSWCGPVSDDKHYLQVDFGRLYSIFEFVIYGDSTSPKWVATYNLNYTLDLVNWKTKRVRKNDLALVNWNTLYKVRKNDMTNNNVIACTKMQLPENILYKENFDVSSEGPSFGITSMGRESCFLYNSTLIYSVM
jgi:hypothetical protein